MNPEWNERNHRQRCVQQWVVDAFGEQVAMNVHERTMRVLEEAIELAQSEGISLFEVVGLANHVYRKPLGKPQQEVGGIGVTLLAYCALKGFSADEEEQREVARILSFPPDHFRQRQAAKAAAGVAMKPSASS